MSVKVSIVTPCYNGEKFIDDYMKSILELDYDNIQLIITDDGSTDGSLKKLNDYRPAIERKGIEYQVLHKENGGQPSAFNHGVKKADGKYLTWPDIDDHMHSDFISKKVDFMEKHLDVDFLLSRSAIVPLNEPYMIKGYTWPVEITDNEKLFDRVLKDYDCWFEPGAFFARMSSFDDFIPNRHIYDECGRWSGPQTQIVMPFFYKGKIGYLSECLYDYHIHDSQDHNRFKDKKQLKNKYAEVKKMLIATVRSLDTTDEEKMLRDIDERIIRTETVIAFQFEDKEWFMEAYSEFDKDMISRKDKARYLIMSNRLIYLMYKVYRYIRPNDLGIHY